MIASPRQIAARLAGLRRLRPAKGVVSVYLNTQWSDEHQRDRARVFLTRELQRAREAGVAAADDLAWIEQEGRAIVAQAARVEAHGVALFACRELGLREVFVVRAPFPETFQVADRPDLHPLVAMLDDYEPALVAFVDGESARLIPLYPSGADEEVRLEGDVPRHHRRGGWAELAQTRYARHIETHRDRHFEAVAQALTEVVDAKKIERILLAGHEDRLSAFAQHLPARLQRLVVGYVHAARWESTSAILARATERLDLQERSDEAAAVDDVLTEAAKGGQAVAGPGTLDAARRAAIHRLYILAGLRRVGRQCEQCAALQETGAKCWLCGDSTREVDIGAALVDRVMATGGRVETIAGHGGLAAAGGFAARLRYPLSRTAR
jgi:peptide subunit release factor 1 (eRF1)